MGLAATLRDGITEQLTTHPVLYLGAGLLTYVFFYNLDMLLAPIPGGEFLVFFALTLGFTVTYGLFLDLRLDDLQPFADWDTFADATYHILLAAAVVTLASFALVSMLAAVIILGLSAYDAPGVLYTISATLLTLAPVALIAATQFFIIACFRDGQTAPESLRTSIDIFTEYPLLSGGLASLFTALLLSAADLTRLVATFDTPAAKALGTDPLITYLVLTFHMTIGGLIWTLALITQIELYTHATADHTPTGDTDDDDDDDGTPDDEPVDSTPDEA